jgi:hypothetical protein
MSDCDSFARPFDFDISRSSFSGLFLKALFVIIFSSGLISRMSSSNSSHKTVECAPADSVSIASNVIPSIVQILTVSYQRCKKSVRLSSIDPPLVHESSIFRRENMIKTSFIRAVQNLRFGIGARIRRDLMHVSYFLHRSKFASPFISSG